MVQNNSQLACTLTNSEKRERLSLIRKKLSTHLLDKLELDAGYAFHFSSSLELRADIELLVELEKQCCAFLDFDLSERDDRFVLSVTGPVSAKTMLAEVFA